ncbi:hypothetical protein BGZ54_000154 [Gamsiella multidivaricata]|nr:hypothetical protein BGZ54_000154 [Gamsiella multidivaricata]
MNDVQLELMLIGMLRRIPTNSKGPRLVDSEQLDKFCQTFLQQPCALSCLRTIFEDTCRIIKIGVDESEGDGVLHLLFALCSFVRSYAECVVRQVRALKCAQRIFLESITAATLGSLMSRLTTDRAKVILWQAFDAVLPLFVINDDKEPLLDWQNVDFNVSLVVQDLLRQIEGLKTGQADEDGYMFFSRLGSTIRLLAFLTKRSKEDILEDEPLLLSSLWSLVQDLTRDIETHYEQGLPRQPDNRKSLFDSSLIQSVTTVCAIQGMRLLNKAHARRSRVYKIYDDDLALMISNALLIRDLYQSGRDVFVRTCEKGDLTELITELSERVIERLAVRNEEVENTAAIAAQFKCEETAELREWLELLLNSIVGDLVVMTDNKFVWRVLRAFHALLWSISRKFFDSSLESTAVAVDLGYAMLSLHRQGYSIMIKSVLARWLAEVKDQPQEDKKTKERDEVDHETSDVESDDDNQDTDVRNADYLELERSVQAAADVLGILKMMIIADTDAGQGNRNASHFVDRRIMDLVDSKLFRDIAQEIRGMHQPSHSSESTLALATELLDWIQETCK